MRDGFTVRTSDSGDLAAVSELLRASYPVLMKSAYEAEMLDPALQLMTRANPELLRSGTWYVAESTVGGVIVGCGGWTREPPGGGDIVAGVGHLRHFGTHPDWTRQGLASAIFGRCEEAARAAGIREFECYSSLNAESFYAALGFQRIASIDCRLAGEVSLSGCHMRYEL